LATQRVLKKNGRLPLDRINRLKALDFVWDPHEAAWLEMWEELQMYKAKYGHCNVAKDDDSNAALATWVGTQRMVWNKNRRSLAQILTQERIDKLNTLDFVWEPYKTKWEHMFSELCLFRNKHGHCNVSKGDTGNVALANWVGTQRQFRKNDRLDGDRIRRLKELGFIWDRYEAKWDEMYIKLQLFKAVHNHCDVRKEDHDNRQLSTWVNTNRRARKYGSTRLTLEQIRKLDEIGFTWNPFDVAWEEMYETLKIFREKNGHCRVPAIYLKEPQLGRWVRKQRGNRKDDKLSEERIRRLEEIGFEWMLGVNNKLM
jgi:hypothetical protein